MANSVVGATTITTGAPYICANEGDLGTPNVQVDGDLRLTGEAFPASQQ